MNEKKWIVGNWKLNHGLLETQSFFEFLRTSCQKERFQSLNIGIAPVAPLLSWAVQCSQNSGIQIAAQNVFYQESGAYTGEWSVRHLRDLGVSWAIIGHSERRRYFAETSEQVAWKARACVEGRVMPIVCVGETLADRESGLAESVIESQLKPVLEQVDPSQICLAYEPVWAIGTGKVATSNEIAQMHERIRKLTHPSTPILYGGSIHASNARLVLEIAHVDGVLVGGASLQVDSFLSILNDATQC
ncbi:MAG: triose-phosphate isomerase [Myxococcaceae bacterium]|nr:triose-phosphate isomerase [Myxococcaceae bacterium]MBH2006038.1 triose-phosphate isomerase [Myxococcaceae bacterium]